MQAKMSVVWIALLALAAAFCPARGDAQNRLPVTVVPNVGNLSYADDAIFSPNGQILATLDSSAVKLWDIATGRPLRTLEYYAFFKAVLFTPDGSMIASAHKDGSVKLWDVATGANTATLQPGADPTRDDAVAVGSLWIDGKGELLVSGDDGGTIAVWDIAQRKRVYQFKFDRAAERITAARLSADRSKLTAVSNSETVKVFDVRSGKATTSFKLPKNYSFLTADHLAAQAGAVGDDELLVRFSDAKCKIDEIMLLSLKDRTRFVSVDKPKSCAPPQENSNYGEPTIFSAQGGQKLIVARKGVPELKFWDLPARRLERTLKWPDDSTADTIGVARDLSFAVTHDEEQERIQIRDLRSGAATRDLRTYGYAADNAVAALDGRSIFLTHAKAGAEAEKKVIALWQIGAVSPRTFQLATSGETTVHDFAPDAMLALALSEKDEIILLSTETGREVRRFSLPGMSELSAARLSPDGKMIAVRGHDASDKYLGLLVSAENGSIRLTIAGISKDDDDTVTSMAFSADGKRMAAGRMNGTAEIWSMDPIRRTQLLPASTDAADQILSLVFSDDGQLLVGGTRDSDVFMWNVAAGRLVRTFSRDSLAGHVNVSSVAVSHDGKLVAGGLAERARSSGDVGAERGIKVWDAATGALRFTLRGHESGVRAVSFSRDGRWLVSASYDGSIRYWDPASGRWMATFTAAADGRWLIITESGLFAGSAGSDDLINVVRGLEAFSVAQFWDHLYRPDLVEQLLKGDPQRRYKDAAFKLNLEKILDSGSAPQIELVPERRTEQAGDTVRVTVRINDTGGGIGEKVVWRVNGVTGGTGEGEQRASGRPNSDPRVVTETLRVDPRKKNLIEVIAYNGARLLATEPYRISIDPFGGVSDAPRPRMFGIAVGVSDYVNKEWKLQLAANDAQAFAQALQAAAGTSGLYDEVKIHVLPQEQATRSGIAAAFDAIKSEVRPTDVFVLYVAGHGRTVELTGTYYFLQRDLTFDGGHSVEDGIGQDTWQTWLKQIAAEKSILVFDTCESAAAAGLARGMSERETAIDRLRYATGRSIITAARQAAYEGFKGHGVLTYAILDALTTKAGAQGHEVDLYGLATQVDREVPEISHSLFGVYQRPHNKIEGNFPLGVTTAALASSDAAADIPAQPTHVVIKPERVRQRAAADAPGERTLEPGSQVRVVEFVGDWAVVARDGQKMGFVPTASLAKLQ